MMSQEDITEYYQPLFNYMVEEHDVILLKSDMDEIISIVEKMNISPLRKECEEWMREVAMEGFGYSDIRAILNEVKRMFVAHKKKKNL